MSSVFDPIKNRIDFYFEGKEPWKIVSITTVTVLTLISLYNLIHSDESLIERGKKIFFRLLRKVPAINQKIDGELEKATKMFEEETKKRLEGLPSIKTLPQIGLDEKKIIDLVNQCAHLGNFDWKNGKVSGAIYHNEEKLQKLVGQVYEIASYTNPLHSDIFPGVCKMEAEIVEISCRLFNGNENACGTMTTGGTESIFLACKAFRDFAKETKGIEKPEIIAPVTAHAAFDKAGQFLNIKIRSVPVDPDSYAVDIAAMEKAINSNTILLVGSAPNFPYGTMDDIAAISSLGQKYDIPVHVDACLGGFLICFMAKAGFELPPFDFRLPGVMSISADTHKYGYAPKGSSVILYREAKLRHHQYTITTDWPGGIYGSPTISGSRAGGIIAACWASLMYFGLNGYIKATKNVVDTTKYIERRLREIPGIFIFGKPATSVIALGSTDFDIYHLAKKLSSRGWNLNVLQFPSGIHICITHVHTRPGVADDFINAVESDVREILKNPINLPTEGMLAMYGTSQSIGDRSIIGDFVKCFLDSMYYLPKA